MDNTRECYGRMFPSLLPSTGGGTFKGKVFGFQVDRPGMVVTRRSATIDQKAWQQCLECPDLDSCYRLSAGTLELEVALRQL